MFLLLCCFLNWPLSVWVSMQINKNWIELQLNIPYKWLTFVFNFSATNHLQNSPTYRKKKLEFTVWIFLGDNDYFLISVTISDTTAPRIPSRYIREFSTFNACISSKHLPSARCTSAANVACRDIDIFGTKALSIKHIL